MLDPLLGALDYMHSASYWIAFLGGIAIATMVGLLPGIGATVMIAIVLPIVLLSIHEPAIGIVMLACITGTGNTFDSIPAQLMGIVQSGSQVTFLEGHQLTRQGKGAYSLGAVYAVSAIGGLVGAACLLLAIPFLKPLILQMGFAEIAMLALFGIAMVGVLSTGAMVKGLVAGALGIFLGTIGLQSYTNVERFTFGNYDLRSGLPLVAAIAGFMAIPEMIDLAVSRKPVAPMDADVSRKEVFRGFREGLRRWKIAIRHSVIGVGLGAIPGAGGNVVTWISYGLGMALTKDKSQFGKGSLDGLLFAESSENSKEGGQAIPTLALGVPGSASWALVLAAMMAYGISPGPDILTSHADIIGLIVISFALANLVTTMTALLITPQLMQVTRIPYAAIVGPILPIVVLGAYFSDLTMTIVPVIIVFGALGLLMKTFGWPRPPLVLGFILAATIEDNLWSAIGVYGVGGILTRPITIALFILTVVVTFFLQRSMRRSKEIVAEEVAERGDVPVEAQLLVAESGVAVQVAERTPLHTGVGASAGDGDDGGDRPRDVGGGPADGESDDGDGDEKGGRRVRLYWRNEHLLPMAFVALSIYIVVQTYEYPRTAAAWLPMSMGIVVGVLSLYQLIRQATEPTEVRGRVLDISMRSAGIVGSKRAAIITAGLLAMYLFCIEGFGIKWGGVPFAILAPLLLMPGRKKWLVSAISVTLYVIFVLVFGDELLAIYWPKGWFVW
ncbi:MULTISPECIES: tripartite tricarboxylate transporter permease [unclassified Mycobacterium]|uniref:tripartite tricarboxylate transporter permease n=1 Tax=unclassified Mycobacterium TaxID=2642494 RepID=UPI0029C8944C|nr:MULTISPECIES: tripartite tricarboxylate transporter permease [unclassified Mycobacterium]